MQSQNFALSLTPVKDGFSGVVEFFSSVVDIGEAR
jgi:hypothetical protein